MPIKPAELVRFIGFVNLKQAEFQNYMRKDQDLSQKVVKDQKIDRVDIGVNLDVNVAQYYFYNCDIAVLNCEYQEVNTVLFKDCTIGELQVLESRIDKLLLTTCKVDRINIVSDLSPDDLYYDVKIDLQRHKYIGWFTISQNSEIESIEINMTYILHFGVKQTDHLKSLTLQNCILDSLTIDPGFTSDGIQSDHFKFIECRFKKRVEIGNGRVSNFETLNCTMDSFFVREISADRIYIHVAKARKVDLFSCQAQSLEISNGDYDEVEIILGSFQDIKLLPSEMNSLFIGSGYRNNPNERLEVEKLYFSHFPKIHKASIKINDLAVGLLDFTDFDNLGKLEVSNVDVGLCKMVLTRLGEAMFNNISFERLVLADSVIDSARFANTTWPAEYLLNEIQPRRKDKDSPLKLADSYR